MSGSIDHLDFDPYSFAESCSRLTLEMRDLERALNRDLEPAVRYATASLVEWYADIRLERRRLEQRAKHERRRRRQQAGQRR